MPRRILICLLVSLAFASIASAQFVPCKFGKHTVVGRSDKIEVHRIAIVEATGEFTASAFIPESKRSLPAALFTHSAIQGPESRADLLRFAQALARAGAASIVLDGTIQWQTPNDDSARPPHLLACTGQWLLVNANVDRTRLALAGPDAPWGGGATPFCQTGEWPCWKGGSWLNFGQSSNAENTQTRIECLRQRGVLRWHNGFSVR